MNDPDKIGARDLERARQVLQIEIHELQRLASRLNQGFSEAVQLLRRTVEADRKIVVLGVGKSGQIGEKVAATLTSTSPGPGTGSGRSSNFNSSGPP